MQNTPRHGLNSVDRALRLIQLLRSEGPLGVSEAADFLGVAPSTAHRVLSTLAHRGFARQGDDRRYYPGDGWDNEFTARSDPATALAHVAASHLHVLVARTGETANAQYRVGTNVRFVTSAESDKLLRIGDRSGRVLPAHRVSGGKAILASLPTSELATLYHDQPELFKRMRLEFATIRKRGYAVNNQGTEAGVSAMGVVIPSSSGAPAAAVSLAIPTARFTRHNFSGWFEALVETADNIARELPATAPTPAADHARRAPSHSPSNRSALRCASDSLSASLRGARASHSVATWFELNG